ncbi:TonB-dependent receptor [Wenzhouxiangella sediminis]|uniref:TonB-dependent receptor n=1 Tax=Wenzhouxiangella sediminis TaxID=1792836 RepID=A0A3E1K7J0_9GAMM|nr:TonB-dependent receptor [Wenzhouxiangella sediminis]RFF29951.1 TonB-dependent receptor [Wenzhouxiangella sediminis]
MKTTHLLGGLLLALPIAVPAQSELPPWQDEPMVVTADFRAPDVFDLGTSVTVIDGETVWQRGASHLQHVLNTAPNVNFSTGTSRGRFFQIRGIGSRSQFVEPMNASVGLLIDGIDLTGLGGAATTLDVEQIEILRGPQGTLFGANALAGLINIVSGSPTEVFTSRVEASVGNYGMRRFEGVISGPINDQLGYRLAYANHQSDGFQDNAFLDRDDVQLIDEQTFRGKLRWEPADNLRVDLTGLFLDVDNGYDGFSLDNTRTTLSDEPGHDRQETVAGSVRVSWRAHREFSIEALASRTDADLEYGYDEDWSFDGFCEVYDCIYDGYSSFDNYIRGDRNTTVDLRAVSNTSAGELGWVVGAYSRDQSQDLRREYTYIEEDFLFDYDSESRAVYGQLDVPLAERLELVAGLRREQRDVRYSDSDGAAFQPDENMWGGKLALEYRTAGGGLAYALASRGYKAGGVNSNSLIPDSQREFATELMWNYELGLKTRLLDGRLDLRTAVFFQDRDDIQTEQSLVEPIEGDNCPCQFIEYKTNATAGRSYGLEAEINWHINRAVRAFASVGLLESQFDDFLNYSHVDADPDTGEPYDMDGRELPHAPGYMFNLGAVFQLSEHWYARVEAEGKDGFFFSSRHETRADPYEMFHARLGYRSQHWDLALWARNITDEDIKTRGFGGFGNDPRDGYAVEPYFQYGEPRVVGVTAAYVF